MHQLESPLSRRSLLKRGAGGALGLSMAGRFGLAGRAAAADAVTLNWLTWSDHYFPEQLQEVQQKTGIAARPQLFSDDADAYIKTKSGGGGWDMSSEDALWVPKFYDEGLIEAFDIKSFPVAKELYPVALNVPFWKAGSNQMGYPFGWSNVQIYYNPKYVKTKPDSWQALLDKKYAKRIVVENQPTDLMAMAGIATGAKHPYDMTKDEIASAKEFLIKLKPNILKMVSQNPETVRALTDESAWLALENLGSDARVKDAGGPLIEVVAPKEGVVGWMDAEMLLKESANKSSFETFINTMETAEWIAKNFLTYGRPLFNEAAYKLLVKQGHQERADRFFYNHPEMPLQMVLKGPSQNEQAYIDAFNEALGA
jgi:spermidine/putrescine transport system substrate-binding protein